ETALERADDSVEICFGEHGDAESDDDQDGEPAEDELYELPGRERRSSTLARDDARSAAEEAHLTLDSPSILRDAPANGERISSDDSPTMHDDVAVQHVDVALDSAGDVQRSLRHGDGTLDRGACGNRARAEGETVGRRNRSVFAAKP